MMCDAFIYIFQGLELLAFERFMSFRKTGGNHLQFNVVSIPAAAAKRALEHIQAAGKQQGLQLQPLEGPVKVCHPPSVIC